MHFITPEEIKTTLLVIKDSIVDFPVYNYFPFLLTVVVCISITMIVTKMERLTVFWLFFSACFHLFFQANFVFNSSLVDFHTSNEITFLDFFKEQQPLGNYLSPYGWIQIYAQFSHYDTRYSSHDQVIQVICHAEIIIALLCFVVAFFVVKKSAYRHPFQLILAEFHLLSSLLYFAFPVITDSWYTIFSHSNPLEFSLFVLFFKGLWICIPLAQIFHSIFTIQKSTASYVSSQNK